MITIVQKFWLAGCSVRRTNAPRLIRRRFKNVMAGAAILLAFGLLTGCGFEALMARDTNNPSVDDLGLIRVLPIPDRSGQILRNHLVDDLALRQVLGAPRYSLEVVLREPRQEIAIRRDESASRVAYTANATFILRDISGRTAFASTSSSSSTYEATTSEFASVTGHRSARDRAMQEISADIRQQLAAYFSRLRRGLDANSIRP